MARILGIGDSMCDKNMTTHVMYPGGQSLNVPANAALQHAQAGFIGCLGNDTVADHIVNTMRSLHIDYSHCRFYPVPQHTAFYKVIAGGERVFLQPPPVRPNPMSEVLYNMLAYEGFSEKDWDYIGTFDMVHCSNDSRIEELFPEMYARGIKISFDFSVYYDREGYMEQVCPYAHTVLFSCAEKKEIRESLLVRATKLGSHIAIATCGSEGALAYCDGKFFSQPIIPNNNVVDTMGAGDAFISAFLVKHSDEIRKIDDENTIIPKALQYAAEYASNACSVDGSFGFGIPFEE